MKKIIMITIIGLSIISCSTYKKEFSCNTSQYGHCGSVTDNYKKSQQEQLGK